MSSVRTFTPAAVACCLSLDPGKTHRAFVLSHWRWPVACAWTPVKCLFHSRSTSPLHDCTVVSFEAHHNSCVNCSLQLHLIVPYNSVYYNYIIITQWLVGWFEDQGKKGVCVGKKVHGGPVYQLLLSTDS